MGFVRWDNLFEQLASADLLAGTRQLTGPLARKLRGPVPTVGAPHSDSCSCVMVGHVRDSPFFLSVSVPLTGWWSGPVVSFAGVQVTAGCAHTPYSPSSTALPSAKAYTLPPGARHLQGHSGQMTCTQGTI